MTDTATRTFGIEIEFLSPMTRSQIAAALRAAGLEAEDSTYSHRTTAHWKMVYDGSVANGHELVSPPLPFNEDGFRQVEIACGVLGRLGARINRTCGLHVHHDARDLSDQQVINIVADYARYEDEFDAMMPTSRKGQNNRYCRTLRKGRTLRESVNAIGKLKTRAELENFLGERYHKVNVESMARHGTLEFRQHSGTVEAEKILAWVQVTRRLFELSAGKGGRVFMRSEAPSTKTEDWLKLVVPQSVRRYVKARIAKHAPGFLAA